MRRHLLPILCGYAVIDNYHVLAHFTNWHVFSNRCFNRLNRQINARQQLNGKKMAKRLGVFDFDHTIVEDNSDIVVRKLLCKDEIPNSVKHLYRNDGWTVYMQEIFNLLHKHKISAHAIRETIAKIKPVSGIKELIIKMVTKLNFDVIIISDSNSLFIEYWLVANGLKSYIHTVFTNPAAFDKTELLTIQMYHLQDTCKLSTKNLCKGQIMEDFIAAQQKKHTNYDQIVYVGDGRNDFCPILRLSGKDLACAREGYVCADMVRKARKKKGDNTEGESYEIKADVCIWSNGADIELRLN